MTLVAVVARPGDRVELSFAAGRGRIALMGRAAAESGRHLLLVDVAGAPLLPPLGAAVDLVVRGQRFQAQVQTLRGARVGVTRPEALEVRDRRRSTRYRVAADGHWWPAGRGEERWACRVEDVSLGGLRVLSERRPLRPGDRVVVQLDGAAAHEFAVRSVQDPPESLLARYGLEIADRAWSWTTVVDELSAGAPRGSPPVPRRGVGAP